MGGALPVQLERRQSAIKVQLGSYSAYCMRRTRHGELGCKNSFLFGDFRPDKGAGIIEQVGAGVADFAPGDPVVISFPWCGECGPCRAARISYCERARSLKSTITRAT